MGVEYAHAIIVNDLSWRPTSNHVERVTAVLEQWGITRDSSWPAYRLENADWKEIQAADAIEDLPANLMIPFAGPEGSGAVRLIGPSADEKLQDELRYIDEVELHFGVDFKVFDDDFTLELTSPPMEGDTPVEPLKWGNPSFAWLEHYPATWETIPPTTNASQGFDGVWRCAIVLDCHKDIPEFALCDDQLPARDFISQIEAALETGVVESGWWH